MKPVTQQSADGFWQALKIAIRGNPVLKYAFYYMSSWYLWRHRHHSIRTML